MFGGLGHADPIVHVKYSQHVEHANARGYGGIDPWKKLKNRYSEIEFGAVSGSS